MLVAVDLAPAVNVLPNIEVIRIKNPFADGIYLVRRPPFLLISSSSHHVTEQTRRIDGV